MCVCVCGFGLGENEGVKHEGRKTRASERASDRNTSEPREGGKEEIDKPRPRSPALTLTPPAAAAAAAVASPEGASRRDPYGRFRPPCAEGAPNAAAARAPRVRLTRSI